jgi:hypothetical protein
MPVGPTSRFQCYNSTALLTFLIYLTALFRDPVYRYKASERMGDSEWGVGKNVEGSGRGLIPRYYSSIYVEGLRKTTKNHNQDSRSPGQDLNPGRPEYEAGVLTFTPLQCNSTRQKRVATTRRWTDICGLIPGRLWLLAYLLTNLLTPWRYSSCRTLAASHILCEVAWQWTFTEWSLQPHAQPQTWRTRVSPLVWHLPRNLLAYFP